METLVELGVHHLEQHAAAGEDWARAILALLREYGRNVIDHGQVVGYVDAAQYTYTQTQTNEVLR